MNWDDLERVAPEITRRGRERIAAARVVLLATLRPDGSPRISPVEPYLSGGRLLFGAMTHSGKTRDLLRDSRCAVHSAVSGPDTGDGELKLYGRAVEAAEHVRAGCAEGWWQSRPEAATVFDVDIDEASFVDWDLVGGEMTVRRWSAAPGYTETRRPYP